MVGLSEWFMKCLSLGADNATFYCLLSHNTDAVRAVLLRLMTYWTASAARGRQSGGVSSSVSVNSLICHRCGIQNIHIYKVLRNGDNVWRVKKSITRMHCSRMHTTRSLTISHCIPCTPPASMHTPQPCTPPTTMHAPHNHTPLQPRMPPCNHACPPQPCMLPQPCTPPTTHAPHNHACSHNHAHPPPHMPPTTMLAPQLCMPPTTMHASHNHACPPQPYMPPCNHAFPPQPCMPPTTTPAPHNHACPPQPCTPPCNHICPPATTHAPHLWTEWLTDRCKNIIFANFICGW